MQVSLSLLLEDALDASGGMRGCCQVACGHSGGIEEIWQRRSLGHDEPDEVAADALDDEDDDEDDDDEEEEEVEEEVEGVVRSEGSWKGGKAKGKCLRGTCFSTDETYSFREVEQEPGKAVEEMISSLLLLLLLA